MSVLKHKHWNPGVLKTRHSKKIAAVSGGRGRLSYKPVLFVLVFVALGTLVIVLTHASTPVVSFEAESGTVNGGAKKIAAANASGGQTIQFNDNTSSGAYNPDPYCWYHVMGSLYGDGQGNGPPNGATWDPSNTAWGFSEGSVDVTNRFARCVQYMIDNNIGGNSVATLTKTGTTSYKITNFWPAGRNVPFPDDSTPQPLVNASALAKRAFLMSVIEGEGEKCDPGSAQCPTAQIADNYRNLKAGVNPTYYLHITVLVPLAQQAGLSTAFAATGSGCTPQTVAQLQAATGAAICIDSSDYQVMKTWPVASCNRVPGYGQVSGYVCGQPDAP